LIIVSRWRKSGFGVQIPVEAATVVMSSGVVEEVAEETERKDVSVSARNNVAAWIDREPMLAMSNQTIKNPSKWRYRDRKPRERLSWTK
jgi:hypothetical protein